MRKLACRPGVLPVETYTVSRAAPGSNAEPEDYLSEALGRAPNRGGGGDAGPSPEINPNPNP